MGKEIKYILFDVAGTLLYKPTFYNTFFNIVIQNGFKGTIEELKRNHKIVSEIIHFPDRTSKEFYNDFNADLLYSIGMLPNEEILEEIFVSCSYLPWERFEDTNILSDIALPMGIISNFNNSLKGKLDDFFGPVFKDIFVSEELGIAKPDVLFYKRAIEQINCSPKNILYIGDSLKLDIQPALKLGVNPLLIDRENMFPNSEYAIRNLNQILNHI